MDKENKGNDLTNVMPKRLIIKIGVEGKLTFDNLQLLPKGKLDMRVEKDEHIWEAVPMIYFQDDVLPNSALALETRHGESACHVIFIKSVRDAADEADGSIKVDDQNKEIILNAITSCLEQPLCDKLQEWSTVYAEYTERYNEIIDLKKMMLDHNEATETPTIPYDIDKYLSGRSDVLEYTMMRNSSLRVLVDKETKEEEFEKHLKKINPKFFEESRLEIEKRMLVKRYTKTLVKIDKDNRTKIEMNFSHDLIKQNQKACTEDRNVSRQTECSVVIEVKFEQ